jgi:hypothetical protein
MQLQLWLPGGGGSSIARGYAQQLQTAKPKKPVYQVRCAWRCAVTGKACRVTAVIRARDRHRRL